MAKNKSKRKNKRSKKKNETHDVKNRILALMSDRMFKQRVVKSKKKYRRKDKHKSKDYDLVNLFKFIKS